MSPDVLGLIGTPSPQFLDLAKELADRGHVVQTWNAAEAKAAMESDPANIRAILLCFGAAAELPEFSQLDRMAR